MKAGQSGLAKVEPKPYTSPMRFSYIARTISGEEQRGIAEANSLEDAHEDLRKKNLLVEEIHVAKPEEHLTATFTAPPRLPGEKIDPLWTNVDAEKNKEQSVVAEHPYVPLIDTFRLFAGWLLAWYAVVYLLGSAQSLGRLPIEIPFIDSLFLSPLILRLSFATYLFLLVTTIHRALGKGIGRGIFLTIVGIVAYGFFHVNV